MIDLRCGDWRTALADVDSVDCLITDPPYSARSGTAQPLDYDSDRIRNNRIARSSPMLRNKGAVAAGRFELPYAPITEEWAHEFIAAWAPRVREWVVVFGDHISYRWFETGMQAAKLVVFPPIAWVRTCSAPRFNADGPTNSCEWLIVARRKGLPRKREVLPGYYLGPMTHRSEPQVVPGGKPAWLMQALVRDYSLHGDLICDPCAGGASTLIAAAIEGRRAIGAEMDPKTHALAMKRIARGYTPTLFAAHELAVQQDLL